MTHRIPQSRSIICISLVCFLPLLAVTEMMGLDGNIPGWSFDFMYLIDWGIYFLLILCSLAGLIFYSRRLPKVQKKFLVPQKILTVLLLIFGIIVALLPSPMIFAVMCTSLFIGVLVLPTFFVFPRTEPWGKLRLGFGILSAITGICVFGVYILVLTGIIREAALTDMGIAQIIWPAYALLTALGGFALMSFGWAGEKQVMRE